MCMTCAGEIHISILSLSVERVMILMGPLVKWDYIVHDITEVVIYIIHLRDQETNIMWKWHSTISHNIHNNMRQEQT